MLKSTAFLCSILLNQLPLTITAIKNSQKILMNPVTHNRR